MLGLIFVRVELRWVVFCCVVMRVVLFTLDFSNPHLCKKSFYCKIQDKRQGTRKDKTQEKKRHKTNCTPRRKTCSCIIWIKKIPFGVGLRLGLLVG